MNGYEMTRRVREKRWKSIVVVGVVVVVDDELA